jgi:hypothetical protein
LWRYSRGERAQDAFRLMGTGTPTRQFLSRTLREGAVVEGEFTIYGKYMLVLECLRYLLLASLKFYLSIFNSKTVPLRLGK